jgi:hypothetical protein
MCRSSQGLLFDVTIGFFVAFTLSKPESVAGSYSVDFSGLHRSLIPVE